MRIHVSFYTLRVFRCATDTSIVTPLRYSDDLRTAFAPIAAFKFADQMIVYFTCQVTLCSKRDNGCEGITVIISY